MSVEYDGSATQYIFEFIFVYKGLGLYECACIFSVMIVEYAR